MIWQSFTEFLNMGGQGRYVWGAWGAALAAMALEAWWARRTLRRLEGPQPQPADLRRSRGR
ncbi:heme exporter protein CcmD [Ideonella sp.]|uniref:heme exporter protein CcmD n=1 Tax=Ideonella sp. TaxID=1929293 RepID=UPI003BB537E8